MYLCYRILTKNIILNKNALTLRNYQVIIVLQCQVHKKGDKH